MYPSITFGTRHKFIFVWNKILVLLISRIERDKTFFFQKPHSELLYMYIHIYICLCMYTYTYVYIFIYMYVYKTFFVQKPHPELVLLLCLCDNLEGAPGTGITPFRILYLTVLCYPIRLSTYPAEIYNTSKTDIYYNTKISPGSLNNVQLHTHTHTYICIYEHTYSYSYT